MARRALLFGAIADDYTGASDLAGMLAGQGVRTVQTMGLPDDALVERLADGYDAVVIALKSRSIDRESAVRVSLEALHRLEQCGARQIQFKYCSTFDSTERGNIGPVTAALLDALGADFTIALPALPINGRTQYMGCLFVHGELLSESPMRDHPLNPMTEPNLVRHLQRQTDKRVGLIDWPLVSQGPEAIRGKIEQLRGDGVRIALVDALNDRDLTSVAQACARLALITGGSGLGMKLPEVWRDQGSLRAAERRLDKLHASQAGTLVLSGSCSEATLGQIEKYGGEKMQVRVASLARDAPAEVDRLAAGIQGGLSRDGSMIVYSSAGPDERQATLDEAAAAGHDAEAVRLAIERLFGALAKRALDAGVRRIIAAGGETAGAVLEAVDVRAVEVLDTLDPGVPALLSIGRPRTALALKSGNFGAPDFFAKAADYLNSL